MPAARRPHRLPESEMIPPAPAEFRIRNQRYPRWFKFAEAVVVGGMLFTFLLIELIGLFFFGMKYTFWILLAAFLAILPIAIHGWLLIWDLNRSREGQSVTARALFNAMFRGIGRKDIGRAIEFSVLKAVRVLLPAVHTVDQVRIGDVVTVRGLAKFPAAEVTRMRFAPDPIQEYEDPELALELCEVTIEKASGHQFRLVIDDADAEQLRQWAESKGIAVCDCDGYRPRPVEPASAN
jgi:hypothetical protein